MKKLYKLVLLSYIGPFIMTFFIAIFILLMQFLWKYIDDLVGKGLAWHVVAELLLYASASLVPMALPLSILLSSIMTFGNMAEHYELVASKSAGVSLQKIMSPLIVVIIFTCIGAFFFSNYALPYANLKMGSLLYDVRQQRPSFSIKEGVFYNGIEGYSIRVGKKDPDGKNLYQIMIYEHKAGFGNTKITLAKSGKMQMSADTTTLVFSLFDGYSYEEREHRNPKGIDTHPMLRMHFKEQEVRLDLSGFKLSRTNEELFKDNYQMLNIRQLSAAKDTLQNQYKNKEIEFLRTLGPYFYIRQHALLSGPPPVAWKEKDFIKNLDAFDRPSVLQMATNIARSVQTTISVQKEDMDLRQKTIARHEIEWHRKFTLSFACLILFFIGAPLGAIIKKGGLGMPVVVSVLFFIAFHILSITGEKFAREGVLPAYMGMWMASAILLPLGAVLTYKATSDSVLFDKAAYLKFFKKIIGRK